MSIAADNPTPVLRAPYHPQPVRKPVYDDDPPLPVALTHGTIAQFHRAVAIVLGVHR